MFFEIALLNNSNQFLRERQNSFQLEFQAPAIFYIFYIIDNLTYAENI